MMVQKLVGKAGKPSQREDVATAALRIVFEWIILSREEVGDFEEDLCRQSEEQPTRSSHICSVWLR